MRPINLTAVINGKRYRTETATLVASDAYWDGHNWERQGRNTYLFRTPRGAYFLQHQTCWQGEFDRIEPVSVEDAMTWYERLPAHCVETFEKAFPGQTVEEA